MMLFTYNKIFKKRTCLFTQNVLYIHIYFLKMKPLQIHEFYIINICTCMHTPTHMAKSFICIGPTYIKNSVIGTLF